MTRKPDPIRYVITSHGHLEGVRLSRLGSRGNEPLGSEEEARAAAIANANGAPYVIERKHFPGRPGVQR